MGDRGFAVVETRHLVPRLVGPVVALVLAGMCLYYFLHQGRVWSVADLDVGIYRDAARAFLAGDSVYSAKFGPPGLPFTYPPFALMALAPLTLLSAGAASLLMFAASAAGLLACIRWCQDYASGGLSGPWWVTVALASVAAVAVEPVRITLGLGQINVLILALILGVDARGTAWAGVEAGLASAVKITPGLLVVAQAVRGDRRALMRGVIAAVAVTVVATVLTPDESWRYFTRLLWDPERPGNLAPVLNQSLRGFWERHLPGSSAAWIISCMLALALGGWVIRRHRHDSFLTLTAASITGLLVSPVSWSHHWVWVLPVVAVGACRGWASRIGATSLLLLSATIVEVAFWTSGDVPLVAQDMYVIVGLAWLLAAATSPAGAAPAPDRTPVAMSDSSGG